MKNGPTENLTDVADPAANGGATCPVPPPLADYLAALSLARDTAQARLGECMLLSWYDRDRNFEAPQHVSECHLDSAVPGYVDYAVHRGATLMIDIESGRFVFFYRPV